MADRRGAPSAIAKAGGALFAPVYVLPLTGAVLFALAMAPAMLPSVLVLWYLVMGFLRHGAAWVKSRSAWLRWGALVAPLALLWSASRRTLAIYQSSLTDAAHAPGHAYWSHQFALHSLYLGWSLLFLLGAALVRFSAKRRTL